MEINRNAQPATVIGFPTWKLNLEIELSREIGFGAVLTDWTTSAEMAWLAEDLTPAEAAAWIAAGDED